MNRKAPLLMLALLAGCADGQSAIKVTVTGSGSVDTLQVHAALGAKAMDFTLPNSPGAAIDLSVSPSFAILFDRDARGTASILVQALRQQSIVATGSGTAVIAPSREVETTIPLTAFGAPDLGADARGDLASLVDASIDLASGQDAVADLEPEDRPGTDAGAADLATPDLAIPDLALAEMAVPDLALAEMAVPDLAIPDLAMGAKLDLTMPDLALPKPDLLGADLALPPGTLVFNNAPTITAAAGVRVLATGDLNGDGKADLIIGDSGGNIEGRLALGGGSFGSRSTISSDLLSIAVGDLDGDGKADVLTTSADQSAIHTQISKGNGGFYPEVTVMLPQLQNKPVAVALGDFDGDGKLDAAVSLPAASSVGILLGKGDGKLGPIAVFGVGGVPLSIAVGDLDGDKKSDLVALVGVKDGSTVVAVFLGKGDGTLGAATLFTTPEYPWWGIAPAVALADFNGDSKLDVAVAGHGVEVLLGTGGGALGPSNSIIPPYRGGASYSSLVIGDFNGDGKPDVVAAGPTIALVLGKGDGTFLPPVHYAAPPGWPPYPIIASDLDGDGKLDVAAPSGNLVSLLYGGGDGTLRAPESFPTDLGRVGLVTDLNGDKKPDLVVSGGDSPLSVFLGTGNALLGKPKGVVGGNIGVVTALAAADFDGDGKIDLGVLQAAANYLLFGNGDGTFQPAVRNLTGDTPVALAVADFDGDHLMDLAIANQKSGNITLLLNDAKNKGSLSGGNASPITVGGLLYGLAAGDFNRDGKADLVVVSDQALSLLAGNGDGSFQAPVKILGNGGGGGPVGSLAAADFNGDASLDVAYTNVWGSHLLLGMGNGTFGAPVDVPGVIVGDFNGDKLLDVAGANNNGWAIDIAIGNGNGTFQATQIFPVAGAALAVDLNGDGKAEVVGLGNAITLLVNLTP